MHVNMKKQIWFKLGMMIDFVDTIILIIGLSDLSSRLQGWKKVSHLSLNIFSLIWIEVGILWRVIDRKNCNKLHFVPRSSLPSGIQF